MVHTHAWAVCYHVQVFVQSVVLLFYFCSFIETCVYRLARDESG